MFRVKDIFDMQNGEVVLNEHILNIPKLSAIKDFYPDPFPAFKFLRYFYDLQGPYADVPEEEKEQILISDFPGAYTMEDDCMIEAKEWLDGLWTPTQRYYLDSKILLENLGKYGREAQITSGRDGNASSLRQQLASVGKTILEFKQLEKVVKQELDELGKSKNRGDQEEGYDEA